jgi:hypothetical protein
MAENPELEFVMDELTRVTARSLQEYKDEFPQAMVIMAAGNPETGDAYISMGAHISLEAFDAVFVEARKKLVLMNHTPSPNPYEMEADWRKQ